MGARVWDLTTGVRELQSRILEAENKVIRETRVQVVPAYRKTLNPKTPKPQTPKP